MKIYVSLCALIFAFATTGHFSELGHGGMWHLREPDYVISSFGLAGMLGWSLYLLVRRWKSLG